MKHILANEISPMLRFAHRIICSENIMSLSNLVYQTYDYRLFFCSEGKITITVKDTQYNLSPESVLYIPSGFKYRYHPETNENARLIALNFDLMYSSEGQFESITPDTPERYRPELQIEYITIDDINMFNSTIYTENFGYFHSTLELILEIYKTEPIYFRKKCSGLLIYLLMELVSNHTKATSNNAAEIINYIQNNYSKKITNTSISKAFNYHPYHLNRIIKKYTGVTLHQYLQNYRITRAIELLNSSDLSVAQISEQVGFDTPQHFCTIFKKTTGNKPSAYRPKF